MEDLKIDAVDILKQDLTIDAYILVTASENGSKAECSIAGNGKQLMALAISAAAEVIRAACDEAPEIIKKGVMNYMRNEFVRNLNLILDDICAEEE